MNTKKHEFELPQKGAKFAKGFSDFVPFVLFRGRSVFRIRVHSCPFAVEK
jgi:hypothetical protein